MKPLFGAPATQQQDINSDGATDFVFQNSAGQVAVWMLDGSGSAVNSATGGGLRPGSRLLYGGPLGNWRLAGLGDINQDGLTDLVFQNNAGQIACWFLDGSGDAVDFFSGTGLVPGSKFLYAGGLGDWRVAGVADMNSDGNPDLVLQNGAGQIAVWCLDGTGAAVNFWTGAGLRPGSKLLSAYPLGDWRLAAIGDVNGDAAADLVLQNTAGSLLAWLLDGTGAAMNFSTGAGLKNGSRLLYSGSLGPWRLIGLKDVNSDAIADLVFQNATGSIVAWQMDGAVSASAGLPVFLGPLWDWRLR
jgi:hypothetical protein